MAQQFDYIVVGGGSAGCAVANRLSADPGKTVLLLEAGKPDNDLMITMPGGMLELFAKRKHQWNQLSTPQAPLNGRRLQTISGKVLGGSSSINAMLHIRGIAADYDGWASDYGCEGWDYANVLPYFRNTETNKNGGNAQRGDAGELHVQSRDQSLSSDQVIQLYYDAAIELGIPACDDFCDGVGEGVGWTQACIKNGERHSSARAFIHPVVDKRDNLTVITEALVTHIDFDRTGTVPRATGVSYTRNGQSHTVTATSEVILSAGALRSPQLLQVSGVGDKAHLESLGIDVVCDLPSVGENLHDHPMLKMLYELSSPISMAGINWFQKLKSGLNWMLFRRGLASWHNFDACMFIRTLESLDIPDIQIQMAPIMAGEPGDLMDEHGITFIICLLSEASRGSVKITSPHMSDAPDYDLGFMSKDEDFEPILRGVDVVRKLAGTNTWRDHLSRERTPGVSTTAREDLIEFIRDRLETDYHYGGTCCMGSADRATTVVTPDLKVKGVEGLRVADASVMPVPMHGNTNHASIMVGAKAADIILGRQAASDVAA